MRVSMQLNLLRQQRFAREQSLTRIGNPAAEKLLASGTALTTVNGALEAGAARSNRQLQKAILEVVRQKRDAGSIEQRRPSPPKTRSCRSWRTPPAAQFSSRRVRPGVTRAQLWFDAAETRLLESYPGLRLRKQPKRWPSRPHSLKRVSL
jgi:hypothetical protein